MAIPESSEPTPSPLKVPYLKNASEILIVTWPLFGGEVREGKSFRLGEKLVEYHFTADLPREKIIELFEPLLTKGEASINVGSRAERMELADHSDRITRGQFRSLLDDFLAEAETRQKRLLEEPRYRPPAK